LLRKGRLKSDPPIAPPQPSPASLASTGVRPHSEAETCFAEAKQAISQGHFESALSLLDQTEALAGPLPRLLLTRVNTLRQARHWSEALLRARELSATHPNSTEAHLALGFIYLLQGLWLDGWREREWRWQQPGFRNLIPAGIPIWDGTSQPDARLWIRCEQGYGDFLQFCRLLPNAAARVGSVVVTVPACLQRLAQASFPKIEFQLETNSPTADTWISLMSLPDRLQWTPPDTAPPPYFRTNHTGSACPRDAGGPIRRIGWVSAGNPDHFNDHNRSLSPECLRGFRLPPSIQAFRVQPDARFTDGVPFELLPPEIKLTDFSDTARWLETLDLVITVDTSVAHLAGGMGIPVWILLPYAPDWRWGTDGETTRWYRSARLIRQPRPNDWQSALEQVQRGLESNAA
jgi:hypothetical protein